MINSSPVDVIDQIQEAGVQVVLVGEALLDIHQLQQQQRLLSQRRSLVHVGRRSGLTQKRYRTFQEDKKKGFFTMRSSWSDGTSPTQTQAYAWRKL